MSAEPEDKPQSDEEALMQAVAGHCACTRHAGPLAEAAYRVTHLLARLESQNQALQEENVKLVQNAGVAAEVLDALRERAERAEELLRTAPPFVGVWNVSGKRSVDERDLSLFVESYNAWADAARNALSPTQETDPRMRCPDCGKPDTINHTEFESIGWMQRSGDPDDCGWRDCATQETDPE